MLDAVAAADGPVPFGEIERSAARAGATFEQVLDTLLLAVDHAQVRPVQPQAAREACRAATARLNAHLLRRGAGSGDGVELASPVTGSGIRAGDLEPRALAALGLP